MEAEVPPLTMTEKLTGLNNHELKSELVEGVGEAANETIR